MAKMDLDKMISMYAARAIFQLKMKVKQNKTNYWVTSGIWNSLTPVTK